MAQTRDRRTGRRRDAETGGNKTEPIARILQPVHRLPVYELASDDALDVIHNASLTLLSDVGIDFYHDEAQAILRTHGVRIDGETAFFDREMIAEYVAKAPRKFTQLARNPARQLSIGGEHMTFAPVYGPPFVYDRDRGRREATLLDFQNFVKLTYLSPYLHHPGGTIVEPTDQPVHTRHLDMIYSHVRYSDKPFMGSVTSAGNAADSIRMAEIVFGEAAISKNPALLSLINVSSPRRYDDRMLGALLTYAKARQALIITPFLFSGAMAPVMVMLPTVLARVNFVLHAAGWLEG